MLTKQQCTIERLSIIAQAANKVQHNKNKSIANEKQLDRLAGLDRIAWQVLSSESVKTTKRESDGLSELNFN